MGSWWSTPTSMSVSPNITEQAVSPNKVPELSLGQKHAPSVRRSIDVSPSSTSVTRATALSRARLKRRRRRMRKKGLANVSRVVTVDCKDSAADKMAAAEVARQIVGEQILVYWPRISAWVDCEVLNYGGESRSARGQHLLRYADGLCEWTELKRYRVVIGAKVFARAVRGRQNAGTRGTATPKNENQLRLQLGT